MTPPLHERPIAELAACLRDGTLTSTALTEHALARIAGMDDQIHAFVTLTPVRARAEAARADAELAQGLDRGPLHGIPYALKDLIATEGIATTAGSRRLLDHVPRADAKVTARLAAAGAVLLGKLATYEFALVGPSFDTPHPPVRHPRDPSRITGGSSSGAAAAVAAGFVRACVGTDTGGSIRSPACYCGVVGLKPSFGRVPRDGVFPLSWSLDHVGPLAASVAEVAVLLDAMADPDGSAPAANALGQPIAGLRIGYARGFDDGHAAPEIARALDGAAQTLAGLGATVEEVTLPPNRVFEDAGAVILQAEAFALHRTWLQQRPGSYGRLAFQTLASGAVLSAADLLQAQRVRRGLAQILREGVFARHQALLVCNTLTTAPRFSDFDGERPRWTPMRTLPFNVVGLPALAVPMGLAGDGLPMGLQLVGRAGDEATLCRIGAAYEAARGALRRAGEA